MLDLATIDAHFPKPTYREGQREVIEYTVNAFNSGKRFVVLECPTGSGKSAIAMTLASMAGSAYYLTVSKVLQDQLTNEYTDDSGVVELKGRNAYPCTLYRRYGHKLNDVLTTAQIQVAIANTPRCDQGFCRTHHRRAYCPPHTRFTCFPETLPDGLEHSTCPYYEQVHLATTRPVVVMNFQSFLHQTYYAHRFQEPRELMIIDESHATEEQLLGFISINLSDENLQEHGVVIPQLHTADEYISWLRDSKILLLVVQAANAAYDQDDVQQGDQLTMLVKKLRDIINLDHTTTEWITQYTSHGSHDQYHSVAFKPVLVCSFVEELLFRYAKRIVLMSGTILHATTFCRALGIPREEAAANRVPSTFPVANRPIHIVAKQRFTGGQANMAKWGPALAAGVNSIVIKHAGQKGIIHTHSFAITRLLQERCAADVRKRMLFQQDFNNKWDMLAAHAKSSDSVLVAPAMHEGIDLIDDLSRFAIICKVPYANFYDDPQLTRRMELDDMYYTWITAQRLVQAYGRSIRSKDDWADTYILDGSIFRFLEDAKQFLPIWFTEAIVHEHA